jgi:uncharacterized protein YdaU (DUF1376 family)
MNRPWMPLYIADYIKDTSHLRALESGAYLHLIMAYWVSGKLPNDDRQLATIAKLTDREWKACKAVLSEFFGPDWSSHKRIDKEIAKATEISDKRRANVMRRYNKPPTSEPTNVPTNEHTLHTSHNTKEEKIEGADAPPPAKRPKSERKNATRMPSDFEPDWGAAVRAQLSKTEATREFEKFKNWSSAKGQTYVDWQGAWRNWCIKAAEYMGKPVPGDAKPALLTITPQSPNWNPWRSFFRDTGKHIHVKLMDHAASNGKPFTVQSEWPPGMAA